MFLLGAGASADANMPLVDQLTSELRKRLPHVLDVNGNRCSEFPELFDTLAEYDPEIRRNYERFFEWLRFLKDAQGPFKQGVRVKLDRRLRDAILPLIWVIRNPIAKILRLRHKSKTYCFHYFSALANFIPSQGPLKVFSTNYDLCVEDACRRYRDIEVITGFHPRSPGNPRRRSWDPNRFHHSNRAINLYKLHGSLNWTTLSNGEIAEHYPPLWTRAPELLLGPGSKIQHDDPFAFLYSEFHQALRTAQTCVVIGYSFRDKHIAGPVQAANDRGLNVIEVRPGHLDSNYVRISKSAKEALISGELLKYVPAGK
jgi:hypothetical protein